LLSKYLQLRAFFPLLGCCSLLPSAVVPLLLPPFVNILQVKLLHSEGWPVIEVPLFGGRFHRAATGLHRGVLLPRRTAERCQ
jgi:hypothetical protein